MRPIIWTLGAASLAALSACGQTDGERALSGAAIGALSAEALDESALTGAAIGGAAGALADDVGVLR